MKEQFNQFPYEQVPDLSLDEFYGIDKNIFIPDWSNKPPYVPPVIKLAGINILTYQNISGIIAAPGSGKTSCMEAIGAAFLNPERDCLGFEVDQSSKGILIIDTERTKTDVWNSFERLCRRAGISENEPVDKVQIVGMRGISDVDERKLKIEEFIKEKKYSLLLIDGVADLVRDTNNLDQAKDTQGWLRSLTAKYDLSIIATIHPNLGGDKARGHSGAELLRDSETILIIKDFEGAKILTSDFDYGKNRNTGKISCGIKWSDVEKMFVSVDIEAMASQKLDEKAMAQRRKAELLAKEILPPPISLRYSDFISAYAKKTSLEPPTIKKKIASMVAWDIVHNESGIYRLNMKYGLAQ